MNNPILPSDMRQLRDRITELVRDNSELVQRARDAEDELSIVCMRFKLFSVAVFCVSFIAWSLS